MKFGKRFISLALALVMIFSLTTGASAATAQNIKVQLSPNITVKLDGEAQTMADVNGDPVYPVLNGGTTYLPVRAVSNMLGVGVDWDGATQTVLLDTSKKTTPTKTDGKAPASAEPSEITVQLSPNITVKLDGKAQSMTDVNGNPVYPLLYDGTTYLPIRAVANMLGLDVQWDGTTQTVVLGRSTPGTTITEDVDGTKTLKLVIKNATPENVRQAMLEAGVDEASINSTISSLMMLNPDALNGTGDFTYTYTLESGIKFKTSEDAEVLGDRHVACDYAEVDYSMADEGYVKVKLTKQIAKAVECAVLWPDAPNGSISFRLKLNQWVNIPLLGSSGNYQLTITPYYSKAEQNAHNPDEPYPENFYVAIAANMEDEDAWMLLSNAYVDFENAPKAVAKAAELTKNCKTDAEKITAIFEFVAKTIKYDYKLYNAEQKLIDAGESYAVAESSRNFSLDNILTSKTGVCQHYAVLMAGMLRSLGIPCKVVRGDAYDGKEWVAHAWVSVSPDTKGLNMTRLGAGHDEDGWIRLDPTWGSNATSRAAAAVDKNHKSIYAY